MTPEKPVTPEKPATTPDNPAPPAGPETSTEDDEGTGDPAEPEDDAEDGPRVTISIPPSPPDLGEPENLPGFGTEDNADEERVTPGFDSPTDQNSTATTKRLGALPQTPQVQEEEPRMSPKLVTPSGVGTGSVEQPQQEQGQILSLWSNPNGSALGTLKTILATTVTIGVGVAGVLGVLTARAKAKGY